MVCVCQAAHIRTSSSQGWYVTSICLMHCVCDAIITLALRLPSRTEPTVLCDVVHIIMSF